MPERTLKFKVSNEKKNKNKLVHISCMLFD